MTSPAVRVMLQHRGRDVHVGTLTRENDEFVFRYREGFRDLDISPIIDFPELDREYRSVRLWAMFQVRIPPLDRPDVQSLIRMREVDADDPLVLLATIGAGRNIASPYTLVAQSETALCRLVDDLEDRMLHDPMIREMVGCLYKMEEDANE